MTAAVRGAHLHFDCVSGIAGDMTLGALLDLGVPMAVVTEAIAAVGIDPRRLSARRVVKGGIAAIDVKVETKGKAWGDCETESETRTAAGDSTLRTPQRSEGEAGRPADSAHAHDHDHAHSHDHGPDHDHAHSHDHGHAHDHAHDHDHDHAHAHDHHHHHYGAIRARISAAPLDVEVRRRALDIFDRVAVAEATLHGVPVDDVVFHEVGAIDSVIDIVGTAAALAYLAPAAVTCARVAMGSGTVRCAHGVLPVPSPAALEIMRRAGGVMVDGGVARELTTPTGAAIVAHAVTAWTPAPEARALAMGWGAGDLDLADRPNVVRVTALAPAAAADTLWRIEANCDDLNPEVAAHAIEHALTAGAVDAWWTPITMKKGRPALAFTALAPSAARAAMIDAILRETTTIGVRFDPVERTVLARAVVVVETELGPIAVKVARYPDGQIANIAPEHDACVEVARARGVALKHVYATAIAAWHRRGG